MDKAILLQQILKTEATIAGGTYGIGELYDKPVAELGRQSPADIFWYDPSRDRKASAERRQQICQSIPGADRS